MFADWDWQILTLPPRHFSWRVRGNPLYWSLHERELLAADYDLLVATSMVDLATLRGLVPELATLPVILYFHENQFGYPQNQPQARSQNLLEAQMVSLYASLAADCMVFNSAYNQDTFLSGCDALLSKLPDKVPPGIVSTLRAKSRVIPVPLKHSITTREKGAARWPAQQDQFPDRPLRILWVGRFEYDKGGDNLLLCLRALQRQGLNYELAVVGQQFRNSPAAFSDIAEEFGHCLVQFGYIESRDEYQDILAGADIVLSTAIHEFQGLAILEAVTAACLPAVPNRLVYPEILPAGNCYPSFPQDPAREAEGAAALVSQLADQIKRGSIVAPDVSRFSARQLEPIYRDLFTSLSRSSR